MFAPVQNFVEMEKFEAIEDTVKKLLTSSPWVNKIERNKHVNYRMTLHESVVLL